MRSWRKVFVLGLVSLSALLLAACEVVGYNTPVVGAGGSAWSTIEAVDPVTGYTKTSGPHSRSVQQFLREDSVSFRTAFPDRLVLSGRH